jgi:dephospho-CoA kinase
MAIAICSARRLLCDALGYAVIALHHIGSTTVPDLVAKDVIDIQLTVPSLADCPYQRIEAAGF